MAPGKDPRNSDTTVQHDANLHATLPLLALYPNLRQTGWALFDARPNARTPFPFLAASGTVGPGLRTRMEPHERIAHQLEDLASVVAQRRPCSVVCSWAGGMNWGAAWLCQLERDLHRWAEELGAEITRYPAPVIRTTIAGKPNASKDALAYAVMSLLNLIGQYRSAPEWEAIAAGYHHLQRPRGEA